jgi:hypothetical protein
MQEIYKAILNKAFPLVVEALRDLQHSVRAPAEFFRRFRGATSLDVKACIVGLAMAVLLTVLSLAALHGANVSLSYDFIIIVTVLNWMLLLGCGVCFWVGSKALAGKAELFSTINAFFYLSVFLVFMKVAELPALGVRISALVNSCNIGDFGIHVTEAISKGAAFQASNSLVFLCYIVFAFWSVKMVRAVNEFGLIRGILATTVTMAALSAFVAYIQEPAIFALTCGYVTH